MNDFCLVCNINGKSQHHYDVVFEQHKSHNQRILGDGGLCVYTKGIPISQPKEISDREKIEEFSYLSKVYSMFDCIGEYNPEYVVWIDATLKIGASFVNRSKQIMDDNGHMILSNNETGGEFSSSDRFFRCIDEDRNTFQLPHIVGGVFGIKTSDYRGKHFLEELKCYSKELDMWFGPHGFPWEDPLYSVCGTPKLSLDKRVKGHRHDQCVIGYIAKKNNMKLHDNKNDPVFYSSSYVREQYLKDPTRDSYHFPADAAVTHHPTEAHLSGTLVR